MTTRTSNDSHRRRLRVSVLAAVLLGSALPAVAESVTDHGKALVETNCARCHAIGETDRSSHPDAPAFRTLSKRYPIADLEEALAEGISTGHPDMPEWIASPEQIDAIIAYIASIQEP
ncbi:cytochrome c [Mesorhizobium sp. M00.F.Ca.ET.186.01.1.1]|nr:cytochrome c [bacterium M00.F.Ca.ET.205.01.1.1]TGU48265.1 cytochrome c [bacterium M00.F.Ca.ET.152.01.1.1]TGV32504.1 cytochrome c [Mesorhizobium sp. M00.F.Ca.ET.186.01.1.1]TGZ39717.1 cytochrome c [bacterium M00.F.Ca.ET.162.01.1.1]TIW63028.1 MAG: cytochrome c [Mesorhizobium sp.]